MVVSIIAVLASVMVPRVARIIDRMSVNGAARHAATVFATARHAAIAQSRAASVHINPKTTIVAAMIGSDTIISRNLGSLFGVSLKSTRDSMAYGPVGLGHGAANLSLIIRRGDAVDTLFTSRVGRVRW